MDFLPQLTSQPQNNTEQMMRGCILLNETIVTGRYFTVKRRATKLCYVYKRILNVQCCSRVAQTDNTHVRMFNNFNEYAKTIILNNAKVF
jgi:hypothetical protein